MNAKQKRMVKAVESLKHYIDTYDKQPMYEDYTDACFINDIIYGLGIALDEKQYSMADGFIRFKTFLAGFLKEHEGKVN